MTRFWVWQCDRCKVEFRSAERFYEDDDPFSEEWTAGAGPIATGGPAEAPSDWLSTAFEGSHACPNCVTDEERADALIREAEAIVWFESL